MRLSKTLPAALIRWAMLPAALGLLGGQADAGQMRSAWEVPAASARSLGRLPATEAVSATLTLALHNQAGLTLLLGRLQDPAGPLYGHYLTPEEFADRFSPTPADYTAVEQYARNQGLTVTATHANRLLLDVSGPARAVETAFGVRLSRYRGVDGRVFRAPDVSPTVPHELVGILTGVAGLSDAAVRRPHNVRPSEGTALRARAEGQHATGSGPGGGLTPQDVKTAYELGGLSLDGSGQALALFELDGYTASDIAAYESRFGLPSVPLQNVLIDTATGTAGTDSDEVTLDIELAMALAPGASKILVYETGNTDAEVLDGYSRIAQDDLAKQVSTSWGLAETLSASSTLQAENAIFQQMAAQGQTVYAASGDNGAYDTGSVKDGLSVDDPASQPYVCGVGGTTLSTSGAGGPYAGETTWNGGSSANGASGGGISRVWPIPSWQKSAVTAASAGSSAMRNVPDVSLNADPNTGYAIYVGGSWAVYGGASCAAPLWAGFTALVNQQRTAGGLGPLGQASPALYPLLEAARYDTDFHDIADGSTNLYYPAVGGYDDATGLGTFRGAALLADLAPGTSATLTAPTAPTNLMATAGSGQAALAWTAATVGHGLQRLPVRDERERLRQDRSERQHLLHRYRADERDDLLLRGHGREQCGRIGGLQRSLSDARSGCGRDVRGGHPVHLSALRLQRRRPRHTVRLFRRPPLRLEPGRNAVRHHADCAGRSRPPRRGLLGPVPVHRHRQPPGDGGRHGGGLYDSAHDGLEPDRGPLSQHRPRQWSEDRLGGPDLPARHRRQRRPGRIEAVSLRYGDGYLRHRGGRQYAPAGAWLLDLRVRGRHARRSPCLKPVTDQKRGTCIR